MKESPISEREYQQLVKGMENIVKSIDDFKVEVRENITGLKTNVEVMKTTFVTKDLLIKVAAWLIGTMIAVSGVAVAYIATLPNTPTK